ncbi:MAG: hypothetical protein Q8886_02805, partial [Candidatus Phytoplasma australasiaticum]|nr:hypothetical protein [Candidatus Phytoplasma australasiaticum]
VFTPEEVEILKNWDDSKTGGSIVKTESSSSRRIKRNVNEDDDSKDENLSVFEITKSEDYGKHSNQKEMWR